MKIRIQGDSIRFRLTRTEVEALCAQGNFQEVTHLKGQTFTYAVKRTEGAGMKARFADNTITLYISQELIAGWDNNDRVGFEAEEQIDGTTRLKLLLEKDFVCLDRRSEDQADHYPNPKLQAEQN
jgi:hypothetical protein